MAESQNAAAVLMVQPARFEANALTAATNEFQQAQIAQRQGELQRLALGEFEGLAQLLAEAGVQVCIARDTLDPHTPDSIFPNNWLSTHDDGTVVLYPMMAENRRPERRPELIDGLRDAHGFELGEVIDFTHFEQQGRFLEGTGSLVLDRVQRIAYACLSPRTHPEMLELFGERLGYRCVSFDALGSGGRPIYHTNVLLAIGSFLAVLCAEAIADGAQRAALIASLESTGHEVLTISSEQLRHFAGNMLELRSSSGERLWVMSRQAERSLNNGQRTQLARDARLIVAPLETIESCSGGSVRCMLAEIHLPRTARHGISRSAHSSQKLK